MRLRLFYVICCVVVSALIGAGCGGSGSGVYSGAARPVQSSLMIVACNQLVPIYTEISASQSISPLVSDTEVEFLHGQNGSKQVCVTTGAAQIILAQ